MREKLIELIGKVQDEGRDYSDPVCSYPTSNGRLADYLIANDVLPVVRCKDCKHYTERKNVAYNGHFCERIVEFVQPDDFCSYGERKDNEQN